MVFPDEVESHPKNPHKHPNRQIRALAQNIREKGWRFPVVVSKRSRRIVAGHCRRDAAKLLGCDMPVDWQDFEDDAEELAVLVADNLIPELAEIDQVKLEEIRIELEDLHIELEPLGFDVESDDNGELSLSEPSYEDSFVRYDVKIESGNATKFESILKSAKEKLPGLFFLKK